MSGVVYLIPVNAVKIISSRLSDICSPARRARLVLFVPENQSPVILNRARGYAEVRSVLRTHDISLRVLYTLLHSIHKHTHTHIHTYICRIRRAEIRYATAYSTRDYHVASDDRSMSASPFASRHSTFLERAGERIGVGGQERKGLVVAASEVKRNVDRK